MKSKRCFVLGERRFLARRSSEEPRIIEIGCCCVTALPLLSSGYTGSSADSLTFEEISLMANAGQTYLY